MVEEKLTEEEILLKRLEELKNKTKNEELAELIEIMGGILEYIADGVDKLQTQIAALKSQVDQLSR